MVMVSETCDTCTTVTVIYIYQQKVLLRTTLVLLKLARPLLSGNTVDVPTNFASTPAYYSVTFLVLVPSKVIHGLLCNGSVCELTSIQGQ